MDTQKEIKALQAALDAALPALENAVSALDCISKSDITELKSFSNPPEGAVITMEAVCLMMGVKPNWVEAKKLLGRTDFVDLLKHYDKDNISPKVAQKLIKYSENSRFAPDVVAAQSKAAYGLCCWVHAMVQYDRVARSIGPKREQLQRAERRQLSSEVVSESNPITQSRISQSSEEESDLRQLSQLALASVKSGNESLLTKFNIQPTNNESGLYPKYFAWQRKDVFTSDNKTEHQESFFAAPVETANRVWVRSASGGWILDEVSKIPVAGVKSKESDKLSLDWSNANVNANAAASMVVVQAKPSVAPFAVEKYGDSSNGWLSEYNSRCLELTQPSSSKNDKRVAGIQKYKSPQECVSASICGGGDGIVNDFSNTVDSLEDELMVGEAPPLVLTTSRESYGLKKVESIQDIKKKNYKEKYATSNIYFGRQDDIMSLPASELAASKFANYLAGTSSAEKDEVELAIPDDWVVVNKPLDPVVSFSASASAEEEKAEIEAESSPFRFGKRQFPVKAQSPSFTESCLVGPPDEIIATTPPKFGRKQFPDKKVHDNAPIYDFIQSSAAAASRPTTETQCSFQKTLGVTSTPLLVAETTNSNINHNNNNNIHHSSSKPNQSTLAPLATSPSAASTFSEDWVLIDDAPSAGGNGLTLHNIAKCYDDVNSSSNNYNNNNKEVARKALKKTKSKSRWAKAPRFYEPNPSSRARVAAGEEEEGDSEEKRTTPRKSSLPVRQKSSETATQKLNRYATNPIYLNKRYTNPSDSQLKMYTSVSQSTYVWKSKSTTR